MACELLLIVAFWGGSGGSLESRCIADSYTCMVEASKERDNGANATQCVEVGLLVNNGRRPK